MYNQYLFIRRIFVKSSLSVCIFIVSGCSALFGPLPVADGTACVSPSPEENPYRFAMLQMSSQPSVASDIYRDSFFSLADARQKALSRLRDNTEHLSDRVDIATNNTNMVRITVTYLDPELIQFVVLNHFLNDPNRSDDPKPIEEFNKKLNDILLKQAERNEILFLVTITSPFYKAHAYNSDVLNVKIPIDEMVLVNGSGKRIKPTHADYVLGANIDITHGAQAGIVGYPTAVMNRGQCMLITDEWTTSLTLEIPQAKLGDTDVSSQFWSIPFRALVMRDENNPIPTYDPAFLTPVSKLESPPTPSWIPNAINDDTNWELYWDEMGRYIWNYVITESHR